MERTIEARGFGRNATVQMAALAAVALAGISIGRWVVPAGVANEAPHVGANAPQISAAATINQRHYESGRLDDIMFEEGALGSSRTALLADSSASPVLSAAGSITLHAYDSGKLDTLPFPGEE